MISSILCGLIVVRCGDVVKCVVGVCCGVLVYGCDGVLCSGRSGRVVWLCLYCGCRVVSCGIA